MVRRRRQTPLSSVEKALALLEALGRGGLLHTISDLDRAVPLGKSTVHRLLGAMTRRGFVRRDPAEHTYSLGIKILELAAFLGQHSLLLRIGPAMLQDLGRKTGETVVLAVRDGRDVVALVKYEPPDLVRISVPLLVRAPAHTSSAGKVLLASLTVQEVAALYDGVVTLPPATPKSITSLVTLRRELEVVGRTGLGYSREEMVPGIVSVAAPVRDLGGQVVASIAVVGNAHLLTRKRLAEITPLLREKALALSAALGYEGSGGPS